MTAYKIACTVIPEREHDTRSAKFLVVAPEDRIVWVAQTVPGKIPDLSPQERQRAVAEAGLKSLMAKLRREEVKDGDILSLTDSQIDCRDRNLGRCSRYPVSTKARSDCPEGACEVPEDECYAGVLECWLLEEEVD